MTGKIERLLFIFTTGKKAERVQAKRKYKRYKILF